jgi:3-hydroxyisobutyrate dehydrogenase
MAARLVDTGYEVTTWDRSAECAQHLTGFGGTAEADAQSAVAASVVITMVTNGEAVHAIAERMLAAMHPDAVWVQASAVGAQWADRLRVLADAHGRTMLDAPGVRQHRPSQNGTLSWLSTPPVGRRRHCLRCGMACCPTRNWPPRTARLLR